MNEHDFEAQLRADGYTEIESQTLEARPGKGRHRHLFAIRGLVLSGTFNVMLDNEPVAHGPGQILGRGGTVARRVHRTGRHAHPRRSEVFEIAELKRGCQWSGVKPRA